MTITAFRLDDASLDCTRSKKGDTGREDTRKGKEERRRVKRVPGLRVRTFYIHAA